MSTKATSRRVKQLVKRYRASTVPLGTKPFPRRFPPPDLEIPRKPERPACGLGVFSAVGFRYQGCNAALDLLRGQRHMPPEWGAVILDELEWRADSWLGRSGLSIHLNWAFGLSALGTLNGTTGASVI